MNQTALQKILDGKIIAIVRGIDSDKIAQLAQALVNGGINCIEVTFDQSSVDGSRNTLEGIANIKAALGDQVCVGAGTVMTVAQVQQAAQAGAEYMISPNTAPDVIAETKRLNKVSIPGAMTPSEVAYAYRCGADIVKMFPAGVLGSDYIKAVKAPLKHIPVTAVGGVNPKNCADFFRAGACGVGVGGNLVSPKLVNEGRFDEITALAQEYTNALAEV